MRKPFKVNPIFLAFLLSLTIISCRKAEEEVITPLDDNSLPSGAVGSISLLQKSANTIRIRLDIAVFRDSRNIETKLKGENFRIDTLNWRGIYAFKLNGVSLREAQNTTAYSALMLMDQSGSISTSDRNNYRLDAAKAFCSNLGAGNNTLLWSFSGSRHYEHGTAFTTDTSTVIAEIEALRNQQGGGTPLYISQVAATDFSATNATRPGKAVLTFSDGDDTRGGYTATQVAENAIAKNVRLFNIGLGGAETEMLCRQALATGGSFMYAKDARQLISMFGNLGKLLDRSARFYQTEWTITRNTDFTSSGSFTHELKITLPYGEVVVPFTVDF